MLSYRLAVLTREKEALELRVSKQDDRLAALEVTYNRGWGVFWTLSLLGGLAGLLITQWRSLFKPWMGS